VRESGIEVGMGPTCHGGGNSFDQGDAPHVLSGDKAVFPKNWGTI
jgi:hypothetical protein